MMKNYFYFFSSNCIGRTEDEAPLFLLFAELRHKNDFFFNPSFELEGGFCSELTLDLVSTPGSSTYFVFVAIVASMLLMPFLFSIMEFSFWCALASCSCNF